MGSVVVVTLRSWTSLGAWEPVKAHPVLSIQRGKRNGDDEQGQPTKSLPKPICPSRKRKLWLRHILDWLQFATRDDLSRLG